MGKPEDPEVVSSLKAAKIFDLDYVSTDMEI